MQSDRHPGFRTLFLAGAMLCAAIALSVGCKSSPPKAAPATPPRYATLPLKAVPPFLKDTIYERVDVVETEPKLVSGFGVVAQLHNTADNTLVPASVRNYIIREMVKRGFGSQLQPGFEDMKPEDMLRSDSVAVVRVDGFVPPGARKGDRFDVQVSALPGTNTSSLAHGQLYRTELKVDGALVQAPGFSVDIVGFGEGPVFANPAYVLEGSTPKTDQAKASLRYGIVMRGGICMETRPIVLRLRAPQRSLARAIELLVEQRFASLKQYQTDRIAAAKDEAIIFVQVPPEFHGDWAHFSSVVQHMYLETRPGIIAQKAKTLAEEAQQPGAALLDISYCWEAIGTPALQYIEPMLASDQPDLAFASARAAAYISGGSQPSAIAALMRMATTQDHPFQLNAINVLGDLPTSPIVVAELRKLLNSDQSLVRTAAYTVLSDKGDQILFSTPVGRTTLGPKYTVDIVQSEGSPLIYGTTQGAPRIAIMGSKPSLTLPLTFTAMDNQLSITSSPQSHTVTMYYRGPDVIKPVRVVSNPDIAEIAARLGGVTSPGQTPLNFSYSDVVAILQQLSDAGQISSVVNGRRVPASFVMQKAPNMRDDIQSAPIIPDQGRPEADAAVGLMNGEKNREQRSREPEATSQ